MNVVSILYDISYFVVMTIFAVGGVFSCFFAIISPVLYGDLLKNGEILRKDMIVGNITVILLCCAVLACFIYLTCYIFSSYSA